MIDGMPNRPLYFYQKDIIGWHDMPQSLVIYKLDGTLKSG